VESLSEHRKACRTCRGGFACQTRAHLESFESGSPFEVHIRGCPTCAKGERCLEGWVICGNDRSTFESSRAARARAMAAVNGDRCGSCDRLLSAFSRHAPGCPELAKPAQSSLKACDED
jgi:hypothetical protein